MQEGTAAPGGISCRIANSVIRWRVPTHAYILHCTGNRFLMVEHVAAEQYVHSSKMHY